jgi:osmotically inducible protein OsmC
MERKATAVWTGGLKDGNGRLATDSGVLSETHYSFGKRFEDEPGTNPEELIGAAHAGCFSMALAGQMAAAGVTPTSIRTTATVSLEKQESGFAITGVHLDVRAEGDGEEEAFQTAARNAKEGCPVSRALAVPITMDAQLSVSAS